MSIADMRERVKQLVHTLERGEIIGITYTTVLIVLVGAGGFMLGRLSGIETSRSPMTLEHAMVATATPQVAGASTTTPATRVVSGPIVASKNGTKYHFTYCPGAAQIKEENKVWFASEADAQKAGYTKAGNCK